MCNKSYIQVSLVDDEGNAREFIIDNDEFLDFLFEVFDDEDRVDVSILEEPLRTAIIRCTKGEFIQETPKPGDLIKQLEQSGFKSYYNYDGDVFKFNPKILNYFIFNNETIKRKKPLNRGSVKIHARL